MDKVLAQLHLANFDPEFFKVYEHHLIKSIHAKVV
ncbi:MAG: hypothetical protein RL329_3083 [Bacteroidota bacterium]|jgi:hypothetical protein